VTVYVQKNIIYGITIYDSKSIQNAMLTIVSNLSDVNRAGHMSCNFIIIMSQTGYFSACKSIFSQIIYKFKEWVD